MFEITIPQVTGALTGAIFAIVIAVLVRMTRDTEL